MNLHLGDYRAAIIREVKDYDYTGHPVVGFVIKADNGWHGITERDECKRFDSESEAISYIGNKWQSRK